MAAYNVVRFKVKPGKEQEVMAVWKGSPMPKGAGKGALIKTGDRTYCFVGEWDSMNSIVAARPEMIAQLDKVRPLLEDPAKKKLGQHGKYDLHVLRRHGVDVRGYADDTMLESFVLNAGIARRRRNRHEAEAGARTWFEAHAPGRRHEDAIDPDSAQAALSELPAGQREVIVAHIWGGLTFEQIAEIAGLSTSSAHRMYHAGLTALRERLGVPCRTNTGPSRPISN